MSTPTVKTTNLGLAVPGPQNPDVGSVAGGTSAGQLAAAISAHDALFPNPQVITAAGAVTLVAAVQAAISLKAGSAAAVSVPAPLAGTIANGGYDGMQLTILAEDAYAYVLTFPANALNGNKHIATWTAAAGNGIILQARNGEWFVVSNNGVTLS